MTFIIPANYVRDYNDPAYGDTEAERRESAEKIYKAHLKLITQREAELPKVASDALDIFIRFFNSFDDSDDHSMSVERSDFFRWESTREEFLWGLLNETHVVLDMRYPEGTTSILMMSAGTGDEGGPSLLYVFYHDETIDLIVQEFDTMLTTIYNREDS